MYTNALQSYVFILNYFDLAIYTEAIKLKDVAKWQKVEKDKKEAHHLNKTRNLVV